MRCQFFNAFLALLERGLHIPIAHGHAIHHRVKSARACDIAHSGKVFIAYRPEGPHIGVLRDKLGGKIAKGFDYRIVLV